MSVASVPGGIPISTSASRMHDGQAGLFAFDEPVDKRMVADLDRLAVVLARQKPACNRR